MDDVSDTLASVLYDPQTSGGLLASLDAAAWPATLAACRAQGVDAHLVGTVQARDAKDAPLVHVAPGLLVPRE
jgi:hypothetical protein